MVGQVPAAAESGSSQDYDVELAEQCEKRELEMSFKQALSNDKRLIWYSLGFSGTIIMEGYGMALITYLLSAFPEFSKKFGDWNDASGKYEVCKIVHSFHVPPTH